jgi:hypothetical protein
VSFQPKPAGCSGCPFEHRGQSYVPAHGPLDASVAIIGQAPGEQEAHSGLPFHHAGASGYKLRAWLQYAGTRYEDVYIDNVVRCWIKTGKGKGDDTVPPRAIAECWQRHVGPGLYALADRVAERIDPETGEPQILRVAWLGTPAMRVGLGPWANGQTTGALLTTELRPLGEGVRDDEALDAASGGGVDDRVAEGAEADAVG